MTLSVRYLIAAAARTAFVVDSLSTRFALELALVLSDLERSLLPVVEAATAGSATAIVKATRAHRTRRAIAEALLASGYAELVGVATQGPLTDVTAATVAARHLAGLDAVLSDTVAAKIDALKALAAQDLLDEGDLVSRALWQATVRGVFGARPVPSILRDLRDVLDASDARIRTLYDTSLSVFGRQVEALHAGNEADTVFAFMGPVDQKTRPFCRDHVGKVYTREEIDALDNGQLDNVFLTGGGYNCRHTWMEVSKFSALRDLLGTDQRAPEVQQQIDRIPAKPVKKAA